MKDGVFCRKPKSGDLNDFGKFKNYVSPIKIAELLQSYKERTPLPFLTNHRSPVNNLKNNTWKILGKHFLFLINPILSSIVVINRLITSTALDIKGGIYA